MTVKVMEIKLQKGSKGGGQGTTLKLRMGLLGFATIGYIILFSHISSINVRQVSISFVETSPDESSVDEVTNVRLIKSPLFQNASDMWAQPTLLNLKNFSWIVPNADACHLENEKGHNLMPILILSARHNFLVRNTIRKSYGSLPVYKNWSIRLFFLLGEANPQANSISQADFGDFETKLEQEQKTHDDLIIGSFIESYHNNSYKSMMGYKWILNYCQEANIVLKTDDNVFIDAIKLIDWRIMDLKRKNKKQTPNVYCNLMSNKSPNRDEKQKSYITMEEWPHKEYPPFCSGISYAITVDLIRKIYSVSSGKYFKREDVFTTGILMSDAKQKFILETKIRNIASEITVDKNKYSELCNKNLWSMKRQFGAVTLVDHGSHFQKNMMCLWYKTLLDSKYLSNDMPNLLLKE